MVTFPKNLLQLALMSYLPFTCRDDIEENDILAIVMFPLRLLMYLVCMVAFYPVMLTTSVIYAIYARLTVGTAAVRFAHPSGRERAMTPGTPSVAGSACALDTCRSAPYVCMYEHVHRYAHRTSSRRPLPRRSRSALATRRSSSSASQWMQRTCGRSSLKWQPSLGWTPTRCTLPCTMPYNLS